MDKEKLERARAEAIRLHDEWWIRTGKDDKTQFNSALAWKAIERAKIKSTDDRYAAFQTIWAERKTWTERRPSKLPQS
jgi:hypothetical protein